ncbi:MAG: DEAD/DEAH box helicase, partial [Pygmaiobacter sp.]
MAATAKVAVENAAFSFDKCYDYTIPESLRAVVRPGSMVLVPFGRGAAHPRMGVVLAVNEAEMEQERLKPLYDAVPEQAMLTPELLRLVVFLKEHTFCTYYEAVRAIIPYGAQYVAATGEFGPRLEKRMTQQTVTMYRLLDGNAKQTEKQKSVTALLQHGVCRTATELCEMSGVTRGVLDTLVKNGVLKTVVQDKLFALYEEYDYAPAPAVLTQSQQKSFALLAGLLERPTGQSALLHGVTGSGKTLVFVELIRKVVDSGKQCLVLVPEIGLTPQMVYRLKSAFGERVAVQHSALSNSERLLQWQQIQRGGADIVVGTRSAVFAPLERLGLIIIDEEQEHTYVSETSPRFSALEVARYRTHYHKALLVLASATPLVDDYYAAKQGRYTLSTLAGRYNAG